jgi:hypothetical protein
MANGPSAKPRPKSSPIGSRFHPASLFDIAGSDISSKKTG